MTAAGLAAVLTAAAALVTAIGALWHSINTRAAVASSSATAPPAASSSERRPASGSTDA